MSQPVWDRDLPCNQLPKLSPTMGLETAVVLKQCIPARAALAELKQAAALLPNPAMLINTLPLLEAQASSEIENIVTTADELFRHMNGEAGANAATRKALRYRQALLEGHQSLAHRPLTTATAEAVCSKIKGVDMQVRRVPGTKLANSSNGEVIYTPPEGEDVLRDLLTNWESFLHAEGPLDPLVRMAAAHYQFESIHPFTDGNGRTGRVLNTLFLVEQELLPLPILYLSRYIIATKPEYYRLLLAVTTDGAWEDWLLYMLKGIEDTARWTGAKIAAVRALSEQTVEYVRSTLPKVYTRELVDLLFEQPYCRISNIVDRQIAVRQTAARYLRDLVRVGVLQERKVGREVLFVNPRLLDLLTKENNEFDPLHRA